MNFQTYNEELNFDEDEENMELNSETNRDYSDQLGGEDETDDLNKSDVEESSGEEKAE